MLKPGQNDYANCAGKYTKLSVPMIRGRSVYLNKDKKRFIFFTGGNWVITSTDYLLVVMEGATGGFYGSEPKTCDPVEDIWSPRYTVNKLV